MKKIFTRWCLLITLLCLLFSSGIFTFANGGPPIKNPIDQSVIFDANSGISLTHETIDFFLFTRQFMQNALVVVEYTLKNTTNQPQELEMYFLTPDLRASEFQASINGKKLVLEETLDGVEPPANWRATTDLYPVDPFSKEPIEYDRHNWRRFYSNTVSRTSIPLSFQPNESIKIQISYISSGGFYSRQGVETIYSQLYYLTPAAFWEDSTEVYLRINLPNKSRAVLHSNLPLVKETGSNIYSTYLSEIPQEEWFFTYAAGNKAIFGTNDMTKHTIYAFLIISFFIILATFLRKRFNNKLYNILYLPAIFCVFFFFSNGSFIFWLLFYCLMLAIPVILAILLLSYIINKVLNYFCKDSSL